MLSKTKTAYNDGVVEVFKTTKDRDRVGVNPESVNGLESVAKFAFKRNSERQKDVELAETLGFFLSRKIRVRHSGKIESDMYARISGRLYEIRRIDITDTDNYLYLDEIICDGQVTLITETREKNSSGISVPKEEKTTVYCRRISLLKERSVAASVDGLVPTLVIRVRSCDYNDQRTLIKDKKRYAVMSVKDDGTWTDISAKITPVERGSNES